MDIHKPTKTRKKSLNSQLITRRRLLKYGFWGTVAAVGVTSTIQVIQQNQQTPDQKTGFSVLRPSDIILLSALIPVILAGAMPDEKIAYDQAIDDLLHNLDVALASFSDANRGQILQLFDLLSIPNTRILTTGLWSGWAKASPKKIDAFLRKWRMSSIGQLTLAYNALTQLIPSIWYGTPANWANIGYPGPPKIG